MSEVARVDDRRARDREFRTLVVLAYPLFLAGAVADRLKHGGDGTTLTPRRNIFAEARAAAYRTLPYAF